MSNTPAATHEEWEKARHKRDQAAVSIARTFIYGNTPSAKDLADFATAEAAMERITAELDGEQA